MHVLEETVYEWLFAGVTPDDEAQVHLRECTHCRTRLGELQHLAHELHVARASLPATAALTRYFHLWKECQQSPALVQRIGHLITASLQWDGRRQPAWQGARNAQCATYRLLYAAPETEIELWIAPQNDQCQVEGEVIARDDALPAWCELYAAQADLPFLAAPCDANGRFRLGTVPTGQYHLHFLFRQDALTLVLNELDLA